MNAAQQQTAASVVIVGAGVVGASVAFHLAEAGVRDVVVVEAKAAGEGATSKATGGIRQQFSNAVNVQLSRESVAFFAEFANRVGFPLDFRQVGYLFVTDNAQRATDLQAAAELQRGLGVNVSALGRDEVEALVPGIVAHEIRGATFCDSDGIASPADACYGFLSAARSHGIELRQHERVVAIVRNGERLIGVRTERGMIVAPTVVVAAGAGSVALCAPLGVDLPLEFHHRQAFLTEVARQPSRPALPFVVDLDTGGYFHQEVSGAFVLGGTDHGDQSVMEGVNWDLLPHLAESIGRRMPSLLDIGIQTGWAGFRDMTPDETALVGKVEFVEGLYCATGFSGHGFMHAPAVGRIVADLITRGTAARVDLMRLSPSRFTDGTHSVSRHGQERQTF